MKKRLLLGIAVITVVLIAFLGRPAVDPEDFTGEWYSASGQHIYRFQNGIIHCLQNSIPLDDGSNFSGAYIFSGKSVTVFAVGVEGLDTVQELYLVENKEEALLCEREDGTGEIYFVRHK